MSHQKEFVCIVCPNSCRLTVRENDGEITVDGASCKRGILHGKNEYQCPMRMLTSTVAVKGGIHPRISVVSDAEIPKEKMRECLDVLYKTELTAPVRAGETIIENICGTGVDIIASREMKKINE